MTQKFLIVANLKQNPLPKYDFIVPQNLEAAVAPQLKDISLISSGFTRAAQTTENNALELKNLGVKYCLVGHSYYRNNFGETNEIVAEKTNQLLKVGITPIICARNLNEIPKQVRDDNKAIIMFEPEEAISTNGEYHPMSPEKIKDVLETFPQGPRLLYGGSVNLENISEIKSLVSGVVIGHASLEPIEFKKIIEKICVG